MLGVVSGKTEVHEMLSGVMLIIVTMFAVLGAYYLSDLLTNCLFRRRKAAEALVVLRADTSEQMWAGVLDARAALPDTAVVVLCPQEDAFTPPGAGMRGWPSLRRTHWRKWCRPSLRCRNNAPRSSGVKQRRARCIKENKEEKEIPGKSRQPKSRMHLRSKVQATRRMPPRPSCTANRAGSAVRRQHGGEARLFRQAKE